MRNCTAPWALAMIGLCFHLHSYGAISVGPGGAFSSFDTQPGAGEWSTMGVAGANTDITSATALDNGVQHLSSLNITSALSATAILPPGTAGLAQWNSTALNLQTRPTGVSFLALLASLENDTGADASSLIISYDFGSAYRENVNESVPGLRGYYSLTGKYGSFQLIPEFSTSTPGHLSATLDLGNWASGSRLYLLWADDNGPGGLGGEGGALEGAYTIDNFAVSVPEPSPFSLGLLGLALAGLARCVIRSRSKAGINSIAK